METNESLELIDYVLSNDNQTVRELSEFCYLFHNLFSKSFDLDTLFAEDYISAHYGFKLEVGIDSKKKITSIKKQYKELVEKYPFAHSMYIPKLYKLYSHDSVLHRYKRIIKFPMNGYMFKALVDSFFSFFEDFKKNFLT